MPRQISTLTSDLHDYNARSPFIEALCRYAYMHINWHGTITVVYIYTVALPYKAENLYKSILKVNFK